MRAAKKKWNILPKLAILAGLIYAVILLVQLQMQVSKNRSALSDLNAQIKSYTELNEELQDKSDHYEKYLELQARKQWLVKPGETVLIEIPGSN